MLWALKREWERQREGMREKRGSVGERKRTEDTGSATAAADR